MTEMTVYVMEETKEALLIVENTSCVVYTEIHSYAEPAPFAGLLQDLVTQYAVVQAAAKPAAVGPIIKRNADVSWFEDEFLSQISFEGVRNV